MPRPATKKVHPRQVVKGTMIRHPKNGPDDLVTDVVMVYRMNNGAQLIFTDEDEVQVLEEQPTLLGAEVIPPKTT